MKNHTKNPLEALILGDTIEAVTTRSRRSLLPINIQLFANGGSGGDGGEGGSGDAGTDGAGGTGGNDGGNNGADGKNGSNGSDGQNDGKNGELDKIIQSRVDRLMADERKKTANLEKELNKLRKEKMSADELKKLEMDEKEKALAEKTRVITEKENRIFAIQAIKTAGLDDGGDTTALVDLVVSGLEAGADGAEDSITERITAIKGFIDKRVAAEVDKTFKGNGRNPDGSGSGSGDDKSKNSVAERLGKQKAEQNKKANDVLNYYIGGKK